MWAARRGVNGEYAISDPSGRFVTAYEIPGLALVMQSSRPALVVALAQTKIAKADLVNRHFNYLQFHTTAGGVQMGHVIVNDAADLVFTNYFPACPVALGCGAFGTRSIPGDTMIEDRTLGTIDTGDAEVLFGMPGGYLALDSAGGSVFAWPEAATKAFDSTRAGVYRAIVYRKDATWSNGAESGAEQMVSANVEVSFTGHLKVQSGTQILLDTDLTAFADADGLHGTDPATSITDPCNGVFVVHSPADSQDTFVIFMDEAVAFASFTSPTPAGTPVQYSYLYGVGLSSAAMSSAP